MNKHWTALSRGLGLMLAILVGTLGFSSHANAQCAAVFWMGGDAYAGLYQSGSTFAFTYNGAQNTLFMAAPKLTGTIDNSSTFSSSNVAVASLHPMMGPAILVINGVGSTTITATTSGGCVATATVTVQAALPDAPTIGIAAAGDARAAVSFTPPASNGGSAITGYTATSNPGGVTGTGPNAPITVTGLTNGTAYTFTVKATNSAGTGAASAASNSVTPLAVPSAAAKSVTTAYNTAASINLTGSITGVSITSVNIVTAPTHGTASVSGETVTYTPSATYYGGSDSFTYTATNAGGTSAAATVSITVGAPSVPTVADKTVSTAYNTAASIDLSGSITGAGITSVNTSTPAHGTVSVSGETVTYTPSAAYYGGSDSFTYTAKNTGGVSAPATVSITVGLPAAPTAADKSVTTPYNTPASIDLTGSITGADITAVTLGTAPTHGTVVVVGETVTYTPSATFFGGNDSFTYTATNAGGTSAPATVSIAVGTP
ncbi:MAG: Ig-like domain-containing protein, partial [Rhodanobacter sp.]